MSYILDALKRLEQDKASARKSVDPMQSLGEHTGPVETRYGKKRLLWLGFGAFLMIVAAVALTYWFVRQPGSLPTADFAKTPQTFQDGSEAESQAVVIPSAVDTSSPRPAESPAEQPVGLPQGLSTSRESASPTSFRVPPKQFPQRDADMEPPRSSSPEIVNTYSPSERDAIPDIKKSVPSDKSRSAGQEGYARRKGDRLKVSAIVWSSDRDKRFAVVNLKTVHEGDLIGDLAVVEIMEDGIVFGDNGEEFMVRLGRR